MPVDNNYISLISNQILRNLRIKKKYLLMTTALLCYSNNDVGSSGGPGRGIRGVRTLRDQDMSLNWDLSSSVTLRFALSTDTIECRTLGLFFKLISRNLNLLLICFISPLILFSHWGNVRPSSGPHSLVASLHWRYMSQSCQFSSSRYFTNG